MKNGQIRAYELEDANGFQVLLKEKISSRPSDCVRGRRHVVKRFDDGIEFQVLEKGEEGNRD